MSQSHSSQNLLLRLLLYLRLIIVILNVKINLVNGDQIKNIGPVPNPSIFSGPIKTTTTPTPLLNLICEDKEALRKCAGDLHPLVEGIPSTKEATETVCRVFSVAMNCLYNWGKKCLKDQRYKDLISDLAPVVDTFGRICQNNETMTNFYKHGDCYTKVTPEWNSCADMLVRQTENLDRVRHAKLICCYKLNFVKCIFDTATNLCGADGMESIVQVAEQTVKVKFLNGIPRNTNRTNNQNTKTNTTHYDSGNLNLTPWDFIKSSLSKSNQCYTVTYEQCRNIYRSDGNIRLISPHVIFPVLIFVLIN